MNSTEIQAMLLSGDGTHLSRPFWNEKDGKDPHAIEWSPFFKLFYLPNIKKLGPTAVPSHEVFRLFRNIGKCWSSAHRACGLRVMSWNEVLEAYALKVSEGQKRVLDFAERRGRVFFLDMFTGQIHSRCDAASSLWQRVENFAEACAWTPHISPWVDVGALTAEEMRKILRDQQRGLVRGGLRGVFNSS